MQQSNSKRPRSRFDDNDVTNVREELKKGAAQHTPASKKYTLNTLLNQVRPELVEMRRQGYTINQLIEFVIAGGIDHNPSTVRHHISNVTSKRKRRKGGKTHKTIRSQPERASASVQSAGSSQSTEQPPKHKQQTQQSASVGAGGSDPSTSPHGRSDAIVTVIPDDDESP